MEIKTITTTVHRLNNEFDLVFEPVEDSIKIKKSKKGYKIRYLALDEPFDSPRDWDNFGTMVCFHNNYSLGDETNLNSDSFNSWEELQEYLIKELKAVIVLPLSLYDHSGISMKVGSFNCKWDSGQVGFIYCTKEEIKAEGISKKRAEEILKAEVETYNQYLTGEVYTVVEECFDLDKNQIDYNCIGGYFGYEYALKELEVKELF